MDSKKPEQKQDHSSFEIVSVLASIVAVILVIIPIISKTYKNQNLAQAQIETKKLAHALLKPENSSSVFSKNSPDGAEGRTLASLTNENYAGNVGKDPWGEAYEFRFLKNNKGQLTHLVVWSKGPNGELETKQQHFMKDEKGVVSVLFQNDDLGYIKTLR